MYYILAIYYYYPGTLNAPTNGELWDHNHEHPLRFESVQDAVSELASRGATYKLSAQSYTHKGVYVTRHGEYASPIYKIRKKRS